jgi:hypothetical protein
MTNCGAPSPKIRMRCRALFVSSLNWMPIWARLTHIGRTSCAFTLPGQASFSANIRIARLNFAAAIFSLSGSSGFRIFAVISPPVPVSASSAAGLIRPRSSRRLFRETLVAGLYGFGTIVLQGVPSRGGKSILSDGLSYEQALRRGRFPLCERGIRYQQNNAN